MKGGDARHGAALAAAAASSPEDNAMLASASIDWHRREAEEGPAAQA